MDIKKIFIVIALICAIAIPVYGASVGKQVDFLAAGLEQDDAALSGGKVYTYEAGTTTAKACYTDREKTLAETNPIILDSEGRTTAFCDGVYKMVIKSSADVTLVTMDGVSYGGEGISTAKLSSYGSLAEAVADIGGTKTVLLLDTTDTLNAAVTVPSNITLVALERDAITLNTKTLTVNGDIWAGAFEWIVGTGTFAGSPVVQFYDPTWTASTVTDSATPSYKAIQLVGAVLNSVGAITNKTVFSNTVSFSKGSDLASAATLTLGADGNYFDVTGTTDISNISGRGVGTTIKLHFDGALTIINSSNIENIGAINVTTAAGDEMEFIEFAEGQWRMTTYSGHIAANFRGALVYRSSNQSIPNNVNTAMTFDSEEYDTDDIHSTVTNTDRLTVPTGVTKVKLSGLVRWDNNVVGYRAAQITKGSSIFVGYGADFRNTVTAGTTVTTNNPFTSVVNTSGGDFFRLNVIQTSGGALDAQGANNSWFAMEIIE